MPLKITVKPNESTRIGRASVMVVSDHISTLLIDGDVPVLRSEHVIARDAALTTLQKLHYVLQEMYLGEDIARYHAEYFALTTRLLSERPDAAGWICQSNEWLINGQVYDAVKVASQQARLEELETRPAKRRVSR